MHVERNRLQLGRPDPAGADWSRACGLSGDQQVGYANIDGAYQAVLWSGSAASCVDLNPAISGGSEALGVSGGQQVGFAGIDNEVHAVLWSGSAASYVDLNPAGSNQSKAYAISGGQEVGSVNETAALWSGTAASYVDLNPTGSVVSCAFAVCDGVQAGYAAFGNVNHAGLWSGTAASWTDLSAFLPAGTYNNSCAYGIYASGGGIWVVGAATNTATGQQDAILWENVVPEPSSLLALAFGLLPLAGAAARNRR